MSTKKSTPAKSADAGNEENRKQAHAHFIAGRFMEAVQSQLKVVNALLPENSLGTAAAMKHLGLYVYMLNDYASCAQVLGKAAEINSGDPEITGNLGVALSRLQQFAQAISWFEKALAGDPNGINWLDGLSRCNGALGNAEATRRFGERSLDLKARTSEAQAKRLQLKPLPPLPAFTTDHPEQHIIAFSLWGEDPRYIEGALRNARLAPDLYPGWTCRFYCDDSVPAAAIELFQQYGAQIVRRPKPKFFYEGLLWRFEAANDPSVLRFLIRDADSLLGAREKAAVDAWLMSDRHFHVMRDFYTHTELILAGMWGGVGGILPPLSELIAGYKSEILPTRHFDQWLLRASVWPRICNSVLIHDSWFRLPNTAPFPAQAWGSPDTHVGQNFAATRRAQQEPGMWNAAAGQAANE
jgi:tetratricopeptide (TPR) repeat protein